MTRPGQEDAVRELLEEIGLEPNDIDEVINRIAEQEKSKKVTPPPLSKVDLDLQIAQELDWKQRAALIANKISNELDA